MGRSIGTFVRGFWGGVSLGKVAAAGAGDGIQGVAIAADEQGAGQNVSVWIFGLIPAQGEYHTGVRVRARLRLAAIRALACLGPPERPDRPAPLLRRSSGPQPDASPRRPSGGAGAGLSASRSLAVFESP